MSIHFNQQKTFVFKLYILVASLVKSTFNSNVIITDTSLILQQILQSILPIPMVLNKYLKYQQHLSFQTQGTTRSVSKKTLPWHLGKYSFNFVFLLTLIHLTFILEYTDGNFTITDIVTDVAVGIITYEGSVAVLTLENHAEEMAFISNEFARFI